jgi:DNA mismatch repair protein MutS2
MLKKRLDDRVNEKLREARVEVDRIVGQLKQKAEAAGSAPRLTTGDLGSLRSGARAALSTIGDRLEVPSDASAEPGELTAPPTIGQTVFVSTFGVEGIVRDVSGEQVDVEIRGKRMRVKLAALRSPAAARSTTSTGVTRSAGSSRSAPSIRSAATSSVGMPVATRELVLIGSTVDDAIARAEKFLDQALLADERRLRIVHGHGTGRLRDGLRTFFKAHPLVASVAPAPDNEGGSGATIVELKD